MILDTSVLVATERSHASLDELVGDEDDVAIAAITAAELLVGVELADNARAKARSAFVDAVLGEVTIEDYGLEVARSHTRLLVHTRRSGRARGAHDLIIAATALARDRVLVTLDRSGFDELPGLALRAPQQ